MATYYNEIEPYAAQWIRNLAAAGIIPDGDVDERSIAEVRPDDLRGYAQCHFFAGFGGWAYAARQAGWPDDRPIWTGSCPCQPFSVAGSQRGFADARHLWPQFRRLISERRPTVVFGEQVASASEWLGLVRGDLAEMGYAVAAIPLEAASAGAEHYRDRYWFVADYDFQLPIPEWKQRSRQFGRAGCDTQDNARPLPYSDDTQRRPEEPGRHDAGGETAERHEGHCHVAERGPGPLVNDTRLGWGEGWTEHEFRSRGFSAAVASVDDCQYVECPDGKWRRLPPPGVRWLGNGIPARIPKLRALGNAIDPRPAAEVIRAYLECV